jgi:hypothetical protein
MSYYILRMNSFANAGSGTPERTIYLLKKRDVPVAEQKDILHLNCSSIKRISGISRLMVYLTIHTSNAQYVIHPYILKRLSWNEAMELFGFDYDSDTSESTGDTADTSIC